MRRVVLLGIAFAVLALAVGAGGDPCIRLRYATFDPLAGQPVVPPDLASNPSPGAQSYYLVQFTGPVKDSWTAALESLGAEVLDYIPDFAFIVRMTPEVESRASHLEHVRWIGPFHPAYRVSPELLHAVGPAKIGVRLFPGRMRAALEQEIGGIGARIERSESGRGGESLEVTVNDRILRRIARHDEIAWIEPSIERKLCNDVARGLMDVPAVWSGAGLFGSGEIVGVCDTGLDTGSLSTISADFAGRVLKTYALGRRNKWNDTIGHGTHVTGSVLGSGVLSGSNPGSHSYSSSFAGIAPEAQVDFQSVLSSNGNLGGIPSDLNQLFQPPYNDGARVHTNSWGSAAVGAYTTDSHNLDTFAWTNKDMTILVAAGNSGADSNLNGVVDLDSMESPATAKNCISVGGTENYRLSIGVQTTYGYNWPGDFPVDPMHSDTVSSNPSGMAAFSSRGPCNDGRIKPDVCAPATNVISCRSHDPAAGTLWGAYNSDYVFCGGTSQSTPLTAGAATLVRQYYRTQKSVMPSSALVKATLINGAKDLNPGQYGTGPDLEIPVRPNNVEGWGLVDLAYSVTPSSPRDVRFVDYTSGLTTGASQSYSYTLTGSSDPFRATLVWTDYPGSTSASTALVNDLDLTVTLPNGLVVIGNGATDRINNVEGVDLFSPATGAYTVTVSAYNVPHGPQPFALVVSGDMLEPLPTAVIAAPSSGTTLFGSVNISGTAAGASFQQYTLDYGAGASPSTWTAIVPPQTTQVTSGLLGIWDTSALANGTYTLRLTVTNTLGGNSTALATIAVLKTSLSQVKDNSDGSSVTLTGKVISAGPAEFGSFMYAQEPDRTSGIRISGVQAGVVIGSLVTVTGTLGTLNSERTINSPTVTVTGSGSGPRPVGMTNRAVGGAALDAFTPGVPNPFGPNNICLLIRTWGPVTAVGPNYFYLDDGFNLSDGSGNIGVKVYTGSLALPGSTQYAVVTGISSTEVSGSTTRRMIRPRTQSDLLYY